MTQAVFFEDLHPGQRIAHRRGRTVTETDNTLFSLLSMNTSQAHFNEAAMRETEFRTRLVAGVVTVSLVAGLASQEFGESVIREVALDRWRLPAPVFIGDTITAFSEVLSVAASPCGGGLLQLRQWGLNQRDEIVCELDRTILVARRNPVR